MNQCLVYAVLAFAALGTPDLFAAQTRFTSTDSIVTVEVPQSWSTLVLNEEADLQVGNEADEIYFAAFNERNVDLFGWNRCSSVCGAGRGRGSSGGVFAYDR